MSSTWNSFALEISDLCDQVKSIKPVVRTKAIDRIDQILNNRENELLELFTRDEVEISWTQFFESVSDGMIKVRTNLIFLFLFY